MRLLMIIVAEEQVSFVQTLLAEEGCFVTEIGNSGEFLQYGEVIIMVGVAENKASKLLAKFEEVKEKDEKHIRVYSMCADHIKTGG